MHILSRKRVLKVFVNLKNRLKYNPKRLHMLNNNITMALKELTAGTIQTLLEEELKYELGCTKHDYQNKKTDNSRNGHSKKTLDSSLGSFEVGIPRDRNGVFEPGQCKEVSNRYF